MTRIFSSLRARLLMLVMLAIIPALSLILYIGFEQRLELSDKAKKNALRIAQQVSHNQNQLFLGAQQLLTVLSQLPEIRHLDAIACNNRFNDILNQFDESYVQLTAFKPNGDLFCSAPSIEKSINIADRKHFKQAMVTRKIAVGQYVISRLLGKPSIFLSQPVINKNGAVDALINVGMNLDWISKLITDEQLPQNAVLTVYDIDGTTLARYPDTAKWLGKPIPEQGLISNLSSTKDNGITELRGPDGVTRLYAYLPLSVQENAAYVAVGLPLSLVLAPANDALLRNLILLCLVTVIAILAVRFGSRYFILRQLNLLVDATRQLSTGNLSARAELPEGTRELTQLGHAFDAMAASLQQKELQRLNAEQALRSSEKQLRNVMTVTGEGIWEWDLTRNLIRHNERWGILLGYTQSILEHPLSAYEDRLHDSDHEMVMTRIQGCLKGDGHYSSEHRIRRSNGQIIWVFDRGDVIERDPRGTPLKMIGSISDITERKTAEEKLLQAATALNVAHEGIFMFWPDTLSFFYVNKGAVKQTEYDEDELLSMTPLDIMPEYNEPDLRAILDPLLNHTQELQSFETNHRCKSGQIIPVDIVLQCTQLNDGQQSMIALVRDISEKKQKDNLIWTQANYDALTSLPNRRLLNDRLGQEIKKAHRDKLPFAVMFIDLDRFKEVNDTLGHANGDLLLIEAAQRISQCVRESDTLARLGGDEFTAILPSISDRLQIEQIAQHIIEELSKPYYFENDANGYYISASIGITLYPDDTQEIEGLLRHADQAMYQAKTEGRKRFSYFTKSMHDHAREKVSITHDLRQALKLNQLQVYYQPIIELASGSIVKSEALLRWKHPGRGMISPNVFIPLAEESGLIHEIGAWVFDQAILNIHSWHQKFDRILPVSINKSPVQFEYTAEKPDWPNQLLSLGLPGSSIVVEITEGLLLKDSLKTKQLLMEFRGRGIEISIDDFGTGFSALSYLKQFDIDYLKIDRSFISKVTEDESDKALTEAIIVMARKLGIQTIAEGVETADQRELLTSFGCIYAQGFLYSPAVPADQFESLLVKQYL